MAAERNPTVWNGLIKTPWRPSNILEGVLVRIAFCPLLPTAGHAFTMIVKVNEISAYQPLSFTMWHSHSSHIILQDIFGRRASLRIGKIILGRRYELAYYTSDYTIAVEKDGKCCNGAESFPRCNDFFPDTLPRCFETLGNISRQVNLGRTRGGPTSNSECAVPCLKRKVVRKGPLHGVLQQLKDDVIVSLELISRGRDGAYKMALSQKEPARLLNLTQLSIRGGLIPISVQVTPSEGDGYRNPKSLFHYGNQFFHVFSADAGNPVGDRTKGSFGEFQVALKDGKESYHEEIFCLQCFIAGGNYCECNNIYTSRVSYFKTHVRQFQPLKLRRNFTVSDDASVIEQLYEPDEGSTQLQISLGGNLTILGKRGSGPVFYRGT